MPQYMRRDRGGKWSATPLADVGFIDPASLALFAQSVSESAGGIFDVFGPTEKFKQEQAVREEYQLWKKRMWALINHGPKEISAEIMRDYRVHTDDVVRRGATASDVAEIKPKVLEWERRAAAIYSGAPVPGTSILPLTAGFPWYAWALAAGLVVTLILKRK